MLQNREIFLKKFNQHQHQQQYQQSNTIKKKKDTDENFNSRWNDLYLLEKRKRQKFEEQKMEKDRKNTERELKECTFTPKLNTSYATNKITKDAPADNNNNTPSSIFIRENAWKQKKISKMEHIIQGNMHKEMEQCMFTPSISSGKILKQSDFYIQAQSLVADPESYEQYITRRAKIRQQEEKKCIREHNLPGAGNIFEKQMQKRNRSAKNLHQNQSTEAIKYPPTHHKGKSIHDGKTQITNPPTYQTNNSKPDKPIEYNQAIRALRDELFSIQLLS